MLDDAAAAAAVQPERAYPVMSLYDAACARPAIGKTKWFQTIVMFLGVNTEMMKSTRLKYPACPTPGCSRKKLEADFKCLRCLNSWAPEQCSGVFNYLFNAADNTLKASLSGSFEDQVGVALLGNTAEEVYAVECSEKDFDALVGREQLQKNFSERKGRFFMLTCKHSRKLGQNGSTVYESISVTNATPVNYVEDMARLYTLYRWA
jgi:hypothetical protein